MGIAVAPGATSVSVTMGLINPLTNGPLTGATVTTLDMTYTRPGASPVKADATDLGADNAAYSATGCYELDSTNAKGEYRFDFADAAFAAGVPMVSLIVQDSNGDQVGRFDVTLDSQTGDSYAIVNHGTYGNAKLLRTGADGDTGETLSDQLDGLASAQTGGGAISDTITVTVSGTPVAGFDVWVSTDEAGDNVIAGVLVTNAQGVVTFDLDIASGLWAHAQKAGYNATGYPKEFNVAAGGFEWA